MRFKIRIKRFTKGHTSIILDWQLAVPLTVRGAAWTNCCLPQCLVDIVNTNFKISEDCTLPDRCLARVGKILEMFCKFASSHRKKTSQPPWNILKMTAKLITSFGPPWAQLGQAVPEPQSMNKKYILLIPTDFKQTKRNTLLLLTVQSLSTSSMTTSLFI